MEVVVINRGANAMQIWPNTNGKIDGGLTNAADVNTLAAGKSRTYFGHTNGWYTIGNS